MALARILSRAELGLEAPLVHVEVHLAGGLPGFSIVGLPAPVVRESRERVRSALINSGYAFPARRITVNLAPVELSKQGGRFDLPIALGVLVASEQLRARSGVTFECYGELGLSGELKPVRGLFLAALHAARAGHTLMIPRANTDEAALAGLKEVFGIEHLRAAARALSSGRAPARAAPVSCVAAAPEVSPYPRGNEPAREDYFGRIIGQWQAKRALVIAASGSHSLLLIGPPGSGKSLLANGLPRLLPALSQAEALEVASICALSGMRLDPQRWAQRPFRAPHHTTSLHAMVGGGAVIRPGEISLAHAGVLFLDELPEFDRRVLEALREPLETGSITLSRASRSLTLPARFQLIAAMNPCPCGYFGDPQRACRCSRVQIARYRQRLSGPLLDRIDMYIEVPRLSADELTAAARQREPASPAQAGDGNAAGQTAQRPDPLQLVQQVQATRARRIERSGAVCAGLSPEELQRCNRVSTAAAALLQRSCQRLSLSARGVQRLLGIGRTIADLAGSGTIEIEHMAEAIQLRRPPDCQCPTSDSI